MREASGTAHLFACTALLLALTYGCGNGPSPVSPAVATGVAGETATATRPPQTADAVPSATALPATASRMAALLAANESFSRGDFRRAAEQYGRVGELAPSPGESATQAEAVGGVAAFREVLAAVAAGDDELAQVALAQARERSPSDPYVRLAAQFLDQYGMTGTIGSACRQLEPQVNSQVAGSLAELQGNAWAMAPANLCSLPGAAAGGNRP